MYDEHSIDFGLKVAFDKFNSEPGVTEALVLEHLNFEKYLFDVGFTIDQLKFSNGQYDTFAVQGIWIAWQACIIRSARVLQLEKEVKSLKRKIKCMMN